ncbi:MAG: exodeoxyribonuclease small subunit [Acidobacteriaceae bacterium]|nr:exodeoxyribonuclease small subunit [Acidobacteriaceae bacterium]
MAKFEDQLAALETVVERLERGELSLDESVQLFEEGVKLSTACKKELDAAEGRIQVLVEKTAGSLVPQDLELEMEEDEE